MAESTYRASCFSYTFTLFVCLQLKAGRPDECLLLPLLLQVNVTLCTIVGVSVDKAFTFVNVGIFSKVFIELTIVCKLIMLRSDVVRRTFTVGCSPLFAAVFPCLWSGPIQAIVLMVSSMVVTKPSQSWRWLARWYE